MSLRGRRGNRGGNSGNRGDRTAKSIDMLIQAAIEEQENEHMEKSQQLKVIAADREFCLKSHRPHLEIKLWLTKLISRDHKPKRVAIFDSFCLPRSLCSNSFELFFAYARFIKLANILGLRLVVFNKKLKSVYCFIDSSQVRLLLLHLFRLNFRELLALHSLLNLNCLLVFFCIVPGFFVKLLNVGMSSCGVILEG